MPTAAAQNNLRVAWAQLQKVSAEGEILTQWDDLGVIANSWQTGDVLVQKHIFAGREEMAASQYEVWVGLYNPETGRRWQTAEGKDRVLLETIEVVR